MNAAIISKEFCHLLLTNPAAALASGCNGESFSLTPDEEELILSIRASSLVDFARQLTASCGQRPTGTVQCHRKPSLAVSSWES